MRKVISGGVSFPVVESGEAPSPTRRSGRIYGEDDRGRHGLLENKQSRSSREDRCKVPQSKGKLQKIHKDSPGDQTDTATELAKRVSATGEAAA